MPLLDVAGALVVHVSRSLDLELFGCTLGCTVRSSSVGTNLEVDRLALGVPSRLGSGRGGHVGRGLSSPKRS